MLLQVMKVFRHPWTGSLYLVFPTKLYESIDGGNQFVEKHMERLPESFDIKEIIFKEDEGLYAVHVLDRMKKRSIPSPPPDIPYVPLCLQGIYTEIVH